MRRCSKCTRDLPADAFASKGSGRTQTYCKECKRSYQRQHYRANIATYKVKAAAWRRARRVDSFNRIIEHLGTHPCVDCGEADPVVLHFDHVRGEKKAGIAELVRDFRPWEEIAEEIAKCDVRCANCHIRRTARQLGWWKHIGVSQGAVDEQGESVAFQAASFAGSNPVCAT